MVAIQVRPKLHLYPSHSCLMSLNNHIIRGLLSWKPQKFSVHVKCTHFKRAVNECFVEINDDTHLVRVFWTNLLKIQNASS